MIKRFFFNKRRINFILVIFLFGFLSMTFVWAFDSSSNNVSLIIQRDFYNIDESVIIRLMGVPLLDNSIHLDIYLLEDSYYSFRYVGLINEDIVFIPQKQGTYMIKLFSVKDGQQVLLSENRFLVEDRIGNEFILASEIIIQEDLNSNSTQNNIIEENNMQKIISSNFSSVKRNKFSGETTNFEKYKNNLSSLKNISNVILENPGKGRIKWHGPLNVLNSDMDSNIIIEDNVIVVNSEILDTSFNTSATLTMYNIPYISPVVLKNNILCWNCNILSYLDGVLEFDVSGFSNYTVVENTSLMIWDNNDPDGTLYGGNLTKFVNQDITFYANYTNQSDNSSISDADCVIAFSDDVGPVYIMSYNVSIDLYTYVRNFTVNDTYQYNITCNKTDFYTLNLTNYLTMDLAGDLAVYYQEINFSQKYPLENENITIYATIYGLTDYNYTDTLIRFYDGNPASGGLVIDDIYINITGISNITINTTWLSKVGIHNIYVQIDPVYATKDLDRNNNIAYNNTFTSLWQTYYGKATPSTANLGSANYTFINWSLSNTASVNIYVTGAGSNINWVSLEAITRNNTGDQDVDSLNDFYDIDLSLGIENFSDSINNTYSIGGYPISTSNYTVYGVSVRDVPEVMSTNNTNFYTGILWDISDTLLSYYSYESIPLSRQDIVFVTKTNHDSEGAYGVYDYEIRIPAFLRMYRGEGDVVQFYYEIQ